MRKDTTFSDGKLSNEEFSKKYWKGGALPYQYHSGTIEDGRDEREQFIFNNMVALHNEIKFHHDVKKIQHSNRYSLEKYVNQQDRLFFSINQGDIRKATALAVTSMVVSVIAIVLVVASYFLK